MGLLWGFCSIPLLSTSVFVSDHGRFVAVVLYYNLRSGMVMPVALLFFTLDCFGYLGSFVFPFEF